MEVERINSLIQDGTVDMVKQILFCIRKKSSFYDFNSGEELLSFDNAVGLQDLLSGTGDWHDAVNIVHADQMKKDRLLKRIKKYLNIGTCWFFTLTFKDEYLNIRNDREGEKGFFTEKQRRNWVRRFLKQYSTCFIANIDFGPETDREHYHGIIVIDDPTFIDKWKYGYSNIKRISDNPESSQKLTKYILKIANHFMKKTVKRNRVIYSMYKDEWKYIEKVKKDPDPVDKYEQLQFWEHLPHLSGSNFDYDL